MSTRTRCLSLSLPILCGLLAPGCDGSELAEAERTPCIAVSDEEGGCQEELLAQGVSSPVPGYRVTTPFGKPGPWAAGYHTGDDYASPTGTKAVAITSARVIEAAYPTSWGAAYGRAAIIQSSDGRRYLYAHLSRLDVSAGQKLSAGQQIGLVGTTGNVTGPHLHFEMRVSPYRYGTDSRKPTWSSSSYSYRQDKKVYASTMKYGTNSSDSVWNLDVGLIHAGFGGPILSSGGPSDTYGSSTKSAVAAFQRSLGFSGADADGIAGKTSVEKLGLTWVP